MHAAWRRTCGKQANVVRVAVCTCDAPAAIAHATATASSRALPDADG
jgi:hypothetical protein